MTRNQHRVLALVSGGKDSCFNMMNCIAHGHEIVALANLRPPKNNQLDEMDSMMYQTVGNNLVDAIAECMDLPLFTADLVSSVESDERWEPEVHCLYLLLEKIKNELDIQAVSVGAILSNYQRIRVEKVCAALDLIPLAYLWQRDQESLLREMIDCQLNAIIVKVASMGLNESHLGLGIDQMYEHLCLQNQKYGVHVCGEGGEYETLTLDCPIFKKRIVIDEKHIVLHSRDPFAPVSYYQIKGWRLEPKSEQESGQQIPKHIREILVKNHLRQPDFHISPNNAMEIQQLSSSDTKSVNDGCCPSVNDGDDIMPFFKICYEKGPRLYTFQDRILYSSMIIPTKAGSVENETRSILQQLESLLRQRNLNLQQHSSIIHLYVRDMSLFSTVNGVWSEIFQNEPCSRACVQTSIPNGLQVALEYCHILGDRDSLHVRGISNWAPANIGPYSQAITIDKSVCFLAGMIGLIPATMQLPSHDFLPQLEKIIQNEISVLQVLGSSLAEIACATFYLVSEDHIPLAKKVWQTFVFFDDKGKGQDYPPTVYIVVDRLPRNALVELQLISHTTNQLGKNIIGTFDVMTLACNQWKELSSKVHSPPLYVKLIVPISFLIKHSLEIQSFFSKTWDRTCVSLQATKIDDQKCMQALIHYESKVFY